MFAVSQKGYSFFGMLGILLVVALIGNAAVYWSSVVWHQNKINDITLNVADFFRKYQEAFPDLIKQQVRINGPALLKNYGLLEECQETKSMFDAKRTVCKTPLGEFDLTANYDAPYLYTYVYVNFNDIYKRKSCVKFLEEGWEKILPNYFWGNTGYIGVISENTNGRIYFSNNPKYMEEDGAQRKPTKEHLKAVCEQCRRGRYCGIQFFTVLNNKIYKN